MIMFLALREIMNLEKDSFRVQFYRLSFKKIKRLMTRHLAMHVAGTCTEVLFGLA